MTRVVTFADEIKPSGESPWAYLGVVSVPVGELGQALGRLLEDRDTAGYPSEIGWGDIRGSGKRIGEKERLATSWLRRVAKEHELWRFSVMGIDTGKLRLSYFGEGKGEQLKNAYRRFYRSNLKLHVSAVHRGFDEVHVVKTYHDQEGRLERDEWFSWHPNAVVGTRKTVRFIEDEVCFVNSCHEKEEKHPKASHFVQLCDLLIGATRYAFEGVGRNDARDRAAAPLVPLLERLNCSKRCANVNSSYRYVGRATLTFFPKIELKEEEMDDTFARGRSGFFRDRRMAHVEKVQGQSALFGE